MSLIEGIGDEVTFGVGLFIFLCLVLLAWLSTHTRDIPFVSVIVIEISQRRHRSSGNNVEESLSTTRSENVESAGAAEGGDVISLDGSEGQGETSSDIAPSHDSVDPTMEDKIKENHDTEGSSMSECTVYPVNNPVLPHPLSESDANERVSESSPNMDTENSVRSACAGTKSETNFNGDCDANTTAGGNAAKHDNAVVDHQRRLAYFTKVEGDDKLRIPKGETPTLQDTPFQQEHEQFISHDTTELSDSQNIDLEFNQQCEIKGGEPTVNDAAEVNENGAASDTASNTPTAESDGAENSQIRVRLKYLNDTQRLVYASPQETIGNFRRTHFSSELEENKIVRFIFNGQDLRNDLSTLRAYNIRDNSVIHCLITQNQQSSQPASSSRRSDEDLEIGTMVFPIFGCALMLIWYLRFFYKQYFSAVSTVSLAGVSFIYIMALLSSIRGRRQARQHLE
ncbi:hypothetical protein C0Q70_03104 [Pomacea canaliculata]|uniref:Ubiquitin-like domain-containing protein n=1 Tax=Pomacea canaliculata TaxID=400727 RepID=A0A2T7PRS7_POMCA|nr:hypothetical protein C0Q70_03104 [Pomacea canaliculata]